MDIEIQNYLSLLSKPGLSEPIYKYYTHLCEEVFKCKQLFKCMWPRTDAYNLTNVSNILFDQNVIYDKSVNLESLITDFSEYFLMEYRYFLKTANASNAIAFQDFVFSEIKNFPITDKYIPIFIDENEVHYISELRTYGKLIGRYYSAWCIVLENQTLFEPTFNTWVNGNIHTDSTKSEIENYPSLPECFLDLKYFKEIIKHPKVMDLFIIQNDGTFKLKQGKKKRLGAFSCKIQQKNKLIPAIKTNQDLAKIFCRYFNVNFNSKCEKQFQPDRIDSYLNEFNFIS